MTKNKRFSPASEKGHFDGLVDEGKYLQQSSLYKQILQRTQRRLKTSAVSSFSVVNNSCYSCPFVVDQYAIRDTQYAQRKIVSTLVERALQIHPFLTNKANFQKSQMHVSKVIVVAYEIMDTWSRGKNKAKTKPIQTQFKANSKPKQTRFKPNLSCRSLWRSRNKPNFLAPLEYFVVGPAPFRFAVGTGPANRRIHFRTMKEKTHLKIPLQWLL